MMLKTLPTAALAGVAIAACPLSVEITGAYDHVAQVAITNTGSEPVTVFKGNTVLMDHPTLDVHVSSEGKELPFDGIYVNYKRTDISPRMFQIFQPGETITTPLNVATTYKLAGVAKAQVTAIQGFRFVQGASIPTTLADTDFCESSSSSAVTIIPDQSKVAAEHISKREVPSAFRLTKRNITFSTCSADQTKALGVTILDAISLATNAGPAAANGSFYFTTWFKSTSVTETVQRIYASVADVQTTSPTISCTDAFKACVGGDALLYTVPSRKTIVPCPSNGYWKFPELSPTCAQFDYDMGGSLLHEMTHLYGTNDYAYGPTAAKKLTAAQASMNADTYEMYSNSVRLGGCQG